MENLETLQNDLKNRLPKEGITPILKALKALLPEHSPKRNSFLQLEADYKALKVQFIDGIISNADYTLAENQIRKRLLDFIDSLEADDFNKAAKRSRLRPDNKIKQGHVLYRIPHQMQLQQEIKCIVRIALDKIALIEDLDLDAHTQVRSEVRVSDYMKVLLIDPAASPAFAIRSDSEPIQFIDEDEATQWEFYVTPFLPGKHILKLKVIVMEIINGVERVREKSLEESVVIVTEAVEEIDDALLQSADMDFVTSDAAYTFEKAQSNFRLPKVVRTSALLLASLIAVSTATYAIAPHEVEWLTTRYWYDTPEVYDAYIQRFENSRHVEEAAFRKADLTDSPQELQEFIENYKESNYLPEAKMELERLEEKAWQQIRTTNNRDSLQHFVKIFPMGRYTPEIKKVLDATSPKDTVLSSVTMQQIQTLKLPELNKSGSVEDKPNVIRRNDDSVQTKQENAEKASKQPSTTIKNAQATPLKEDEATPVTTEKDDKGKEERLWKFVQQQKNTKGYEEYLKRYPNGQFTDEAYKLLNNSTTGTAAQREERLWQFVQQQNNAKGYDEYLKRYPKGRFVEQADNRLKVLVPERLIEANMVFVKGDTFQMGEKDVAEPVHTVTVSDFSISKYEVTFEEYDAFCDATKRKKPEDEGWGRGKRPVINVSWEDATAYCKWLSEKTGQKYRLPTEAEWEYAARGGVNSKGYKYAGSNDLDKVAWYYSNSKSKTQPVGGKAPNELGLYDMSGNVYEWVQDCWTDSYKGAPTNGSAWLKGDCSVRVIRGGSWYSSFESYCRVAYRDRVNYPCDFVGFRLVRD